MFKLPANFQMACIDLYMPFNMKKNLVMPLYHASRRSCLLETKVLTSQSHLIYASLFGRSCVFEKLFSRMKHTQRNNENPDGQHGSSLAVATMH